MAKPTYCPRCSRMHDVLLMECPRVDEPISEAALAELEGLAQKLRRTSMVAPGPLVKLACDEVPRLIAEVRRLNLQVRELQEIVDLCVQQGGLNFHVEGGKCPEDDTCDCPDALRVNAAMKGYTPEVRWAKKCEDDKHDWRDARNEIVTSGEFCIKCGALRAGNATTIEKRKCVGCGKEDSSVLKSRDGRMRCHDCDNPTGQDH